MRHTVAIVAGSEGPAVSISWEEPIAPTDSGYCLILSDVDPDNVSADGAELVCVGCLLDDSPEIGPGLDLARGHGIASLVNDEWVPGDFQRHVPEAGE